MKPTKMTFTNEPKETSLTLGYITMKLSYDPLHGVSAITDIDHAAGTERIIFLTDDQMVFLRDWFNNSIVVSEEA